MIDAVDLELTAVFCQVPEGNIGFVERCRARTRRVATLEEARANLQEAIAMVFAANRELIQQTTRGADVIREPLKFTA